MNAQQRNRIAAIITAHERAIAEAEDFHPPGPRVRAIIAHHRRAVDRLRAASA